MQNEPVLEIDKDGTKWWYLNGELHRTDGPAIERLNGNKYWYLNGKRHRVDGPAIEYSNGNKYWCLDGVRYTFNEWLELTPISSQEKVKLRLMYAE